MALVTVLVEVERVKMAMVCRSASTVSTLGIHLLQRDWMIQKCCVDFPPVVKLQLKVG